MPKEHYRNLLEMDATSASQLFAQVPKVAQKVMKATKAAGMNIIANCEEVAGQTVFHTHVHLVPRYSADDDLKIDFIAHEPDFDKLAQVAETIKKRLRSCHEIIQSTAICRSCSRKLSGHKKSPNHHR